MTAVTRKWLSRLGYVAFYLVSFVVFVYLTFPFDKLRNHIVNTFNAAQQESPNPSYLQIDELSSYWFTGVEAEGVRLISPPSAGPDGSSKPASTLKIEHASARLAILPLLLGRITVDYTMDAFGGSIEGYFSKRGDDQVLEMEADGLQVGQVQPIVDMVGLPMKGDLSGHLTWKMPKGKLSHSDGSIDFTIASLTVGDGKAKIQGMIALPRVRVGNLTLRAKAKRGRLTISKFAAKGSDLILSSTGRIDLRDRFAESKIDLFLKFKFTDKYKAKNEKTKVLFGDPSTKKPGLLETMVPKMKRSKRPDGFYSWRIWGLMRNPRYDPAPRGPSSKSFSKGKGTKRRWPGTRH